MTSALILAGCGSSTPSSLPVRVAAASDPGLSPRSCQVSTTGKIVIATGGITPPIAYPSTADAPTVSLTVYDSQGAVVDEPAVNEGGSVTRLSNGAVTWQATAYIEPGFQPAACSVDLTGAVAGRRALAAQNAANARAVAQRRAEAQQLKAALAVLEPECQRIGGTFATDSPIAAVGDTHYACDSYDAQLSLNDDLVSVNGSGDYSYDQPLPASSPFLVAVNQAYKNCAQHDGGLIYASYLNPPQYQCATSGSTEVPLVISQDGSWSWQSPLP